MSSKKPSHHPGMGAVVHPLETTFRVWAPFASSVAVAGNFNNWSPDTDFLAREGNGYWSCDLPQARKGDRYQYVIINAETGNEYWRNDPYAREVTHSVGDSVIVADEFDWGDDGEFRMPSWNELVLYEMHVGTFNDEHGGRPGDLSRAIDRLPYLHDLGINAIEIMPLTEFAADYSWGYNPGHLFAVESAYGGPFSLKTFIKTAHSYGIAVIIDVVYNHFGPSDLDLWRFDGWSENGKGGIYFYNDWRAKTPWGHTRPDYGRSEVRSFIRDNALMWLKEFHADGLRWDSTINIRTQYNGSGGDIHEGWSLMQWVNSAVRKECVGVINIAEDLQENEWITKQVHEGGAGFDTQWAAGFTHPVRDAVIAHDDRERDMLELGRAITGSYNGDAFQRVIYTESHDEVANGQARVPEAVWPGNAASWFSRKRSTLGAVLVFTASGIPMLFQGQELLEDEWFRDTDPVDWSKLQRFGGIHALYRDLVRLRRNWHNHTAGLKGRHVNVFHINNQDKLLAYHRWENGGAGDDVVVVVNMSNRSYPVYTIGFPRSGKWRVRFNSDWSGYSSDYSSHPGYDTEAYPGMKDGLRFHGAIGIGAYSALILSQDAER
ncbi:alpha-amylase family glycosyl hydrolase [Prosthecochloris marina]|nr:alpha-amylase family glycosyl hydrolase [Prosthecochloris marina]